MSDKEIIDAILRREGKDSNLHDDHGGRTSYGISEKANPQAWEDNKVTEEEARGIYESKYIKGPGFDRVQDDGLRAILVDWGVNSGPGIAIQGLQRVLGTEVDGVLGDETLGALHSATIEKVSKGLVSERVKMIGRIVSRNPNQAKFLNGWLSRALEFL